jgi:Double zinc ribbon
MGSMDAPVPFTDNYRDLSNAEGYQFEFVCERCGNGYRSPFVPDIKRRGMGLMRSAGSLLGGRMQSLSYAADRLGLDRGTNSKAKDKALADAVDEVMPQFKQCRGCGNWVCQEVCWNEEIGQCVNCSPRVAEEISKAQAIAQVEQIQQKTREHDWTSELDLTTRAKVQCPDCGATVDGGKFCPECGGKLAKTAFCTNCGAEMKEGAKFCAECGTKA